MDRRQFLTASAAVTAIPGAVSASESIQNRLDAYLRPFAERNDFSGLVLMSMDGKIIASGSYGYANIEFAQTHAMDVRYDTASIGKMFTRSAIIALEKAGKLEQDAPLSSLLPSYPGADSMTIRQLVNHEAGIARDLILGDRSMEALDTAELINRVAKVAAISKPGVSYAYSNNGYRILARVIEIAGKGDYGSIVRETVLEPYEMRDTAEHDLFDIAPKLATGYVAGSGWNDLRRTAPVNLLNYRGAGSYITSPRDLLRFVQTLPIEQKDLDDAVRTTPDGKPRPRTVGHDGFGNGFANFCYSYPDENASLIMLGNIASGLFGPLHADLRNILFGNSVTPPPMPADVFKDNEKRAKLFVGSYELYSNVSLIVEQRPNGLFLSGGDDGFHRLLPVGPDSYFMRMKYARVRFNLSNNKVVSLTWTEGGSDFTLKKIA